MNLLILSAGTRNKVVQYFKQECREGDRIIATDCSNLAPAVYEADVFYLVPRITHPDYLKIILDICKKEQITGVLSLIDPELSLLAKHEEQFKALGVTVIGSPYDLVETCFNKYAMYEKLTQMRIATGKCYLDKELFYRDKAAGRITYPVFVKPVCGSASMHINKVSSDKELEVLFDLYEDLMIQEFMDGQEYGADVYLDLLTGKVSTIFVKKKIKMRAGETDKSVSVKDEALFSLIQGFAEDMGFKGIIDIDIFKIKGTYYISEVNPRFGGGYPHAYESGVNVPRLIMQNLRGEETSPDIGSYEEGICMMKYNEVLIRRIPEAEIVE
ncbi:MAG: ATP-grasp domain-containing protein [Lachnospiraceae bacterium]|nr:ATP-grasp domain-containing protein [Lachnospiraceae bacterium]